MLEDLQLVKPSVLFAVPTLHKKMYDGVHNLMESASPIRQTLMKKVTEGALKILQSIDAIFDRDDFLRLGVGCGANDTTYQ